jgi:hypothetical protein
VLARKNILVDFRKGSRTIESAEATDHEIVWLRDETYCLLVRINIRATKERRTLNRQEKQ